MAERNPYANTSTLVKQLRSREISSVELIEQSICRIERLDEKINAIVIRDFDRARMAARCADDALSRGDAGALLGLPITVKESYSVAGLPKSWGASGFVKNIEDFDAVVVERLKNAGAIILGKTNVPTNLADWQTYNDIYGVTNNPWDFRLTAGGSSGGSAAAVAAGFVSLEFGSDLNGSLRMPAHCCGIYSHNPSYGLVPQRGHEPPGSLKLSVGRGMDFAVNGPFARSAVDLGLALNVIAGPDDDVAVGYKLSLPKSRHTKLENFRVLIITHHPYLQSSNDVEEALENCARHLMHRGVTVERFHENMIDLESIAQIFVQQLMAMVCVELSDDAYKAAQKNAATISPQNTDLHAVIKRSQTLTYRDFARAGRTRAQLRHQWRELFKNFDVVLCPVMPIAAFLHDHTPDMDARVLMVDDRPIDYGDVGMWNSVATLTGQPSTVMPIAFNSNGLPLGMQIIGPFLEDFTTIEFAKCLEREFGGFKPPQLD